MNLNKKGQSIAEMAIFGSLILVIFGSFISYSQSSNDQQYTQMEVFRRALERACTYQGAESRGAGASVQFIQRTDRRNINLNSGFWKGSTAGYGASSSVFWAVPKVGEKPESITVVRLNEDQKEAGHNDYYSAEDGGKSFQVLGFFYDGSRSFSEISSKAETPTDITNTATSQSQETLSYTIPYAVTSGDSVTESGVFWSPVQGMYRDSDGQYKFSEQAVGTVVERGRSWQTRF